MGAVEDLDLEPAGAGLDRAEVGEGDGSSNVVRGGADGARTGSRRAKSSRKTDQSERLPIIVNDIMATNRRHREDRSECGELPSVRRIFIICTRGSGRRRWS